MPETDPQLARARASCLALPDTREAPTWGELHLRLGDEVLAGHGEDDDAGRRVIGSQHGSVSTDGDTVPDRETIRAFVQESSELIAPKKSLAKLPALQDAGGSPRGSGARRRKSS